MNIFFKRRLKIYKIMYFKDFEYLIRGRFYEYMEYIKYVVKVNSI